MINWLWAIPWVVIIIFVAGWIVGSRRQKKLDTENFDEKNFEYSKNSVVDRRIEYLFKRVDDLESRLETSFGTMKKEEN